MHVPDVRDAAVARGQRPFDDHARVADDQFDLSLPQEAFEPGDSLAQSAGERGVFDPTAGPAQHGTANHRKVELAEHCGEIRPRRTPQQGPGWQQHRQVVLVLDNPSRRPRWSRAPPKPAEWETNRILAAGCSCAVTVWLRRPLASPAGMSGVGQPAFDGRHLAGKYGDRFQQFLQTPTDRKLDRSAALCTAGGWPPRPRHRRPDGNWASWSSASMRIQRRKRMASKR